MSFSIGLPLVTLASNLYNYYLSHKSDAKDNSETTEMLTTEPEATVISEISSKVGAASEIPTSSESPVVGLPPIDEPTNEALLANRIIAENEIRRAIDNYDTETTEMLTTEAEATAIPENSSEVEAVSETEIPTSFESAVVGPPPIDELTNEAKLANKLMAEKEIREAFGKLFCETIGVSELLKLPMISTDLGCPERAKRIFADRIPRFDDLSILEGRVAVRGVRWKDGVPCGFVALHLDVYSCRTGERVMEVLEFIQATIDHSCTFENKGRSFYTNVSSINEKGKQLSGFLGHHVLLLRNVELIRELLEGKEIMSPTNEGCFKLKLHHPSSG